MAATASAGETSPVLTFGQLQTLKAISDTGSFSKAARKLYLSQPAVSQRIRAIEDTLGVELFDRDSGGTHLAPTAEGAEVVKFAVSALEQYAALVQRLSDGSYRESSVSIGAVGFYVGTYVLPRIIPLIHAAHPNIRLRMVTLPFDRLTEAPLSGAVDIALMSQPRVVPGLQSVPLWEDEIIMVCHPSRASQLLRHPRVIPLILTGLSHDIEVARAWCAGLGIPAQIVVESMSADTLRNAALSNLGYALLPEIVVRGEIAAGTLVQVPVHGLPKRRIIVAAYTPERAQLPAVAKFLSALGAARSQLKGVNSLDLPLDESEQPAAIAMYPRHVRAGA